MNAMNVKNSFFKTTRTMKTAVEWLHEQFKAGFNYNIEEGYEKRRDELFEEAKEMEQEQIEDAFANGVDDEYEYHINNQPRRNSEQYYKETFKQQEQ
jgi:hypothetical protein